MLAVLRPDDKAEGHVPEHVTASFKRFELSMVLKFSETQFAAFEGRARDEWCRSASQDLFEAYEAHYTAFGASPDGLIPMVQAVAAWAQRHGINSQADVTRLCHVAASLGHRFWQDPRFRGYVAASTAPEIPTGRRAIALMTSTKGWLRALWAGDILLAFSKRLGQVIRAEKSSDAHTLQYVLPGHWQLFNVSDNDQLLAWLAETTPEDLRDSGPRQIAYTACALAHGAQWISDPQYPRLAQLIRTEMNSADLAEGLESLYAEATA